MVMCGEGEGEGAEVARWRIFTPFQFKCFNTFMLPTLYIDLLNVLFFYLHWPPPVYFLSYQLLKRNPELHVLFIQFET